MTFVLSSAPVQRRQGGIHGSRGPVLQRHMALVDASDEPTGNRPSRPAEAAPDRCTYCGFRVATGALACGPHSDLPELDIGEARG